MVKDSGIGVFNDGVVKNGLVNLSVVPWSSDYIRTLAWMDGVKPSSGTRLKEVLMEMHPALDMKNGEIFQVVRW